MEMMNTKSKRNFYLVLTLSLLLCHSLVYGQDVVHTYAANNNLGQLLRQEPYGSGIDLEDFNAGIYFIKVMNESEPSVLRVIKED